MDIETRIAGTNRIQNNEALVQGQKYGFIWGDDNVVGNPFVIGEYQGVGNVGNNLSFHNCKNANTGEFVGVRELRQCLKNETGPFYNVDRVNQTGGKRKQQSRRLKKRKGLRKRTKTRSRRT